PGGASPRAGVNGARTPNSPQPLPSLPFAPPSPIDRAPEAGRRFHPTQTLNPAPIRHLVRHLIPRDVGSAVGLPERMTLCCPACRRRSSRLLGCLSTTIRS